MFFSDNIDPENLFALPGYSDTTIATFTSRHGVAIQKAYLHIQNP